MRSLQDASVFDMRSLSVEEGQERYGLRILVMRAWPRGISRRCLDLWVPDAGPSRDLLRRYRDQELDWEQFRTAYIQEQSEARSGRLIVYPHNGIDRIETRSPVRPVALLAWYARRQQTTLLCWERTGNCHRQVLLELVNQAVIEECTEVEALQKLPAYVHRPFLRLSTQP